MGDVLPLPNNRGRAGRGANGADADAGVNDDLGHDLDHDLDPDSGDFALYFDDEEDEELIRQWEEAERECVVVLREALPEVRAAAPPDDAIRAAAARIRAVVADQAVPYFYLANAAGWGRKLPADDRELWLGMTGSLVAMRGESGLESEIESELIALELGDWVGAVIGLVRAGVGAPGDPPQLAAYIDECPEVEGEETDPDDILFIQDAFHWVTEGWQATGALDEHLRLTPLGWWGLPRALAWAWQGDFESDHPPGA